MFFSFVPASLRKGPISSAVFLLFRPPVCNTTVAELTYYFVLILHIKLGFNKHIKVMEHNLTFFLLNQDNLSESKRKFRKAINRKMAFEAAIFADVNETKESYHSPETWLL